MTCHHTHTHTKCKLNRIRTGNTVSVCACVAAIAGYMDMYLLAFALLPLTTQPTNFDVLLLQLVFAFAAVAHFFSLAEVATMKEI